LEVLPQEVQALILAAALPLYKRDYEQFHELMQIRWVSRQLRQVIDQNFLPSITKLSAWIHHDILLPELLLLTNLQSLTPTHLNKDVWQPELLFERLPKLTQLNLSNLRKRKLITNEQLLLLATRLTSLRLDDDSAITIDALAQLTLLRTLSLAQSDEITNEALGTLTDLTALDARANTYIDDTALAPLTNLTDLRLSGNERVSDRSISQLTRLERLDLVEGLSGVTDKALIRLTRLRQLDLDDNKTITDVSLATLHPSLVTLNLRNNERITDASLSTLTGLTNLKMLGATHITGSALLLLTRLESLWLYDEKQISDASQRIMRERDVAIQYLWPSYYVQGL
jgi:hypothetical protein